MLSQYVDFTKGSFWKSVAVTASTPMIWNTIARAEYRTGVVTRCLGGNNYVGAYAMAAWIFGYSTYRDLVFSKAIEDQPKFVDAETEKPSAPVQAAGYSLMAVGTTLVMSSFYHLGVTGTFLGDYFGILMDHMVTDFPFSILRDPMYVGATMNFLGLSVVYVK